VSAGFCLPDPGVDIGHFCGNGNGTAWVREMEHGNLHVNLKRVMGIPGGWMR
jgi:hypothetical protein